MLATKKLKLYDIQEYMVNELRKELMKNKRVILQAATGVGKTILATWMIKQAMAKDKRVLFCCDRISLINQTSDVFHDYGIEHGIFQAENPLYAPNLKVQIGSIQTLARRKQQSYDFILIDECHAFAKAHEKIMEHNPDAYVLGLTASPFSKGLGKHFDSFIEPVPVKQLIKQGFLCPFEIYGPQTIHLDGVKVQAGEYKNSDLAEVSDKPKLVADVVETWQRLAKGQKTIVFCTNVAHGRHLQKEFNRKGIVAREINGYMKKDGDDGASQLIEDFRNNKFLVFISTEMLVKGFDQQDITCVQFATATKSIIKWIQACGRGLRTFPGKSLCTIIDHGSNAERLGFPDEYEILELDDGKKQETKNKKQEKPEKQRKPCPSCDFLKPVSMQICPRCGYKSEYVKAIETEKGELEKLQRKDRQKYTLKEKQEFLGGLNRYAASKGMKQHRKGFYGWARYRYQDKFNCNPSSQMNWSYQTTISKDVKEFIEQGLVDYVKTKKVTNQQINKINGKIIKLQKPCSCGGTAGMMVPEKMHIRLECAMCGKYVKWISKNDAVKA
ncbi:MAG: DEAD/DEAH box helicase family protein [Thermodesulfobacteriota bacterium]|nr:DEAD/DEAH box helicase family protein [Thermodesulfobacteriota bacterium]